MLMMGIKVGNGQGNVKGGKPKQGKALDFPRA